MRSATNVALNAAFRYRGVDALLHSDDSKIISVASQGAPPQIERVRRGLRVRHDASAYACKSSLIAPANCHDTWIDHDLVKGKRSIRTLLLEADQLVYLWENRDVTGIDLQPQLLRTLTPHGCLIVSCARLQRDRTAWPAPQT